MIRRIFTSGEQGQDEPVKGFDAYDLRLGDVMRGERATLGKSLLTVQRELKIKAAYISAIENADPSAFESPSFIAGYVRSYARYLGMDPEWAFKTFCEESGYAPVHGMSAQASSATLTAAKAARAARQNSDPISEPNVAFAPARESAFSRIEPGAIGSMLVLLALIGGIGYGGWSVLQEVQRVQFVPVEEAPGLVPVIDPLAPSAAVVAAVDEDSDFITPTPDALDRLYRPQALEVPVMVARDGPIATLDPQQFDSQSSDSYISAPDLRQLMAGLPTEDLASDQLPSLSPDPTLIKTTEAGVPEVAIFAVKEAWVRVRSASGTVIFEKVMQPGEKYVLPKTEDPATLRTGYAGTVYFAVNGETYGPAGEGASVVSKVALGEADIKAKYALADLNSNEELRRVVAELSQ